MASPRHSTRPRSRPSSSPTRRSRRSAWGGRGPRGRARRAGGDVPAGRRRARAGTLGAREGFTRLVVDAATDRVVGVHVVGPHASELAAGGDAGRRAHGQPRRPGRDDPPAPTISEGLHQAAELVLGRPIHMAAGVASLDHSRPSPPFRPEDPAMSTLEAVVTAVDPRSGNDLDRYPETPSPTSPRSSTPPWPRPATPGWPSAAGRSAPCAAPPPRCGGRRRACGALRGRERAPADRVAAS